MQTSGLVDTLAGFEAEEYHNGNQIVVAFRGTDLSNLYDAVLNILVDSAWVEGAGGFYLAPYVAAAAQILAAILSDRANTGKQITLTGHSLGGAIAQILGYASGLPTVVFDAPAPGNG